jgi:hypothetical protein
MFIFNPVQGEEDQGKRSGARRRATAWTAILMAKREIRVFFSWRQSSSYSLEASLIHLLVMIVGFGIAKAQMGLCRIRSRWWSRSVLVLIPYLDSVWIL